MFMSLLGRYHHPWSSPSPGGHWPRKGVWSCAAVMTPFFQANRRSLAYQFTINAPLMCPPFTIFSLDFGQNFSSQDAIFPLPRPLIFQGKSVPMTLLLKNPTAHTQQKKVECPLPRAPSDNSISPKMLVGYFCPGGGGYSHFKTYGMCHIFGSEIPKDGSHFSWKNH